MKNLIIYIFVCLTFSSCFGFLSADRSILEFDEVSEVSDVDSEDDDNNDNNDSDTVIDDLPTVQIVDFKVLKEQVLEPNSCINCHGWANSEKDLLDGHRVKLGDADASLLFILVRNGAMPRAPLPQLSSEQLEIVEKYINGLAKNTESL